MPLPVGNATVPVRLVAMIRAFPGAGNGTATVIVDQPSLQAALAAQAQPPLPVTGWWLRTAHGVPPGLPAGASAVSLDRAAAALLGDPLPNVPQLALLVIAVAAALLAAIGFVVCVVAAVTERRLQDALLAALGMGRGARTGQLCLEQLMLSLPAAAAGALIGVGLARLLVPAVTLTSGAAAPFPPVRVVVPLGWIGAAGAGGRGGTGPRRRGGRGLPPGPRRRAPRRGVRVTAPGSRVKPGSRDKAGSQGKAARGGLVSRARGGAGRR